jgi:hypothetical protein
MLVTTKIRRFRFCDWCNAPVKGQVVAKTTAEFSFCSTCASYTDTPNVCEVLSTGPIKAIPSADPTRQFDGGAYGYSHYILH